MLFCYILGKVLHCSLPLLHRNLYPISLNLLVNKWKYKVTGATSLLNWESNIVCCFLQHFRGRKNRCYSLAVRAVRRAFVYASKARKAKRRSMRQVGHTSCDHHTCQSLTLNANARLCRSCGSSASPRPPESTT